MLHVIIVKCEDNFSLIQSDNDISLIILKYEDDLSPIQSVKMICRYSEASSLRRTLPSPWRRHIATLIDDITIPTNLGVMTLHVPTNLGVPPCEGDEHLPADEALDGEGEKDSEAEEVSRDVHQRVVMTVVLQ